MVKLINQTPLFDLPDRQTYTTLLAALPNEITPRVGAEKPASIGVWEQAGGTQVHPVNYATDPQMVRVHLASPSRARVIAPDWGENLILEGTSLSVDQDGVNILIIE